MGTEVDRRRSVLTSKLQHATNAGAPQRIESGQTRESPSSPNRLDSTSDFILHDPPLFQMLRRIVTPRTEVSETQNSFTRGCTD